MEPNSAQVVRAMLFLREGQRLRAGRYPTERFALIAPGVYLDTNILPPGAKPWEIDRTVTKARCHALLHRIRPLRSSKHRSGPVITAEAALVAQEISTWNSVPPIIYRDQSSPGARLPFPKVRLGSRIVPAVRTRNLGPEPIGQQTFEYAGLRIAPSATTIVDMTASLPPLPAYANTCEMFAATTGFSNLNQKLGRYLEEQLRCDLSDAAAHLSGRHGIQRARAVINKADAGSGSVLEAGFIWLLHCNIRPSVRWTTQHQLSFEGTTYFADAAVPHLRLALEFDGTGKMGADFATVRQRAASFLDRAQSFANNGWVIRRLTSKALRDPNTALAMLREALNGFGILRPSPGGPLWADL